MEEEQIGFLFSSRALLQDLKTKSYVARISSSTAVTTTRVQH